MPIVSIGLSNCSTPALLRLQCRAGIFTRTEVDTFRRTPTAFQTLSRRSEDFCNRNPPTYLNCVVHAFYL
eukprot:jgi/Botrbrau1/309/Bobra.0022s0273.1